MTLIHRTPFISSMIKSAGYHAKDKVLEIEYNTGVVWRYENVQQHVWDTLLQLDTAGASIGRYVNSTIKPIYEGKQVTIIRHPDKEAEILNAVSPAIARGGVTIEELWLVSNVDVKDHLFRATGYDHVVAPQSCLFGAVLLVDGAPMTVEDSFPNLESMPEIIRRFLNRIQHEQMKPSAQAESDPNA